MRPFTSIYYLIFSNIFEKSEIVPLYKKYRQDEQLLYTYILLYVLLFILSLCNKKYTPTKMVIPRYHSRQKCNCNKSLFWHVGDIWPIFHISHKVCDPLLKFIISEFLSIQILSKAFKKTEVVPSAYKNKDRQNINNYWPVSMCHFV